MGKSLHLPQAWVEGEAREALHIRSHSVGLIILGLTLPRIGVVLLPISCGSSDGPDSIVPPVVTLTPLAIGSATALLLLFERLKPRQGDVPSLWRVPTVACTRGGTECEGSAWEVTSVSSNNP